MTSACLLCQYYTPKQPKKSIANDNGHANITQAKQSYLMITLRATPISFAAEYVAKAALPLIMS